ncbi:hypothetical protein BGX21_011401 [Mortierella sp. AD011]|nr:hypothetical protein BGX20_011352 [Mortierella sp. AD010]KAF9390726.1 hypothetical protein BGX21_011401 [Mortierella sp. AD011]
MEKDTASSVLQSHIPQVDSPSRHNSVASDTENYPPDLSFTVSPLLGLGAKLSQAFASYTVVFLLISAYRLFLIRNSVDIYIINAKQILASDCLALEKTATNLASIPHFAAQNVNNGLVTALDSTISRIGYGLEIVLAGFLSTIDFVIGILTGTWRCFLENLANSGMPLLSEIGTGGVEALDQMHDAIIDLFSLPLSGLGEIIQQRMENPQIEQFVNVPTMPIQKIEFCAKSLNLAVMDNMGDDLRRWILYGTYAILIMALLAILVNMIWITFLHKRSKVHVKRIIRQLKVLSEMSNESVRMDPKSVSPLIFEGKTVKILKYCASRISYMTQHPYVFRFVDWSSKRIFPKDREKQGLYFWFLHYIANPQAVGCLFIGLYGLIFVYCQLALINYAREHYRPVLTAVLTDVSDLALEAVNRAMSITSQTFANKTNTMLLNVEVDLNTNVFSNITQAAGEINASLLQVQSTLVQGIQGVFGDGAFGQLVLTVLQCLLLNKLAVLETGLVWIQQNAKIDLPRLPNDVLMIEPSEMNNLLLDAVNGIPSISNWNSSRVIEGIFNKFEEEQRQILPVYYGLDFQQMSIGETDLIFLGTGTSSGVPVVPCLTAANPTCKVCLSTQTPEGVKNIKRNTSAMVSFMHQDGRKRNILIDCGKSFYESARQWFPKHSLHFIDALVITHGHADAVNGLDDLRSWCLIDKEDPYSIPVYLDQETMDVISSTFPYMVDASKATGGGDVPSFTFNVIDHDKDFEVEGIKFTPLPVHHGIYFTTGEPYWSLGFRFRDISWVSDCSFVPESTSAKIRGSKVLIMDGLKEQSHPSHFSISQAVEYSNTLDPKPERTFIVGFCHTVDHYAQDEKLQALDGQDVTTFRIAYDGQKITL